MVPEARMPQREIQDKANIFVDAWQPIFYQTPAPTAGMENVLKGPDKISH
ncbi:hypothetical protein PC129_g13277 [Phytophthora cactorum]|uniref:Uncharacterized protein n=1 Tax=Phytophthora cactorum TaxID=29920 RepID=A0A8T1D4C6_9STRA|nr:hypothetical protein Pcac1_g4313 [Phytophthora cactorum]KAG2902925.1 hypothetical protein PC114_g12487 [Phytophthora cactorum]KAG2936837.1 hypothetical protein PC117_g11947 [Phytophthora cactorum]KAG3012962.1 hypothetical protein PC120_g13571 [Phytophthora cactorum]KAG3037177.1 hypothetical protein PC119_g3878 [Phytophthora cactorum]